MNGQGTSLGVVVGSMSRAAGGLFQSVRAMSLGLAEAGTRVSVYSPADADSSRDMGAWRPIVPTVFRRVGFRPLNYAPKLLPALLAGDHDVVQLHGLWQYTSVQAAAWQEKTRRPLIVSPHGMLDPWALRNSSWKKKLVGYLYERANLHGASCLRALNDSEASAMRDFGLRGPIAIIPNGVSFEAGAEKGAQPANLTGSDGRQIMLFLGRLHPKKGLTETIEAWRLLKGSRPGIFENWVLVIAGWGDERYVADLKSLTRALDMERDILFPGPVFGKEKEALLAASSAFILASYSEGLPVAVLEAWVHAKPVFMTTMCNLAYSFQRNAAIEISTDPAQISAVLADRLGAAGLESIGRAGRALAEADFSWEVVTSRFIALNRWLTGGGDRPGFVHV